MTSHQIHLVLVQQFLLRHNVLGVTLDTHLTFTQHCNNIAIKVQQRNNVLKALAGSTWGGDKETLLTTNQAIGRSILSYCCPVWTPSPKDTNWSRLQRAQNSALSIITVDPNGCCLFAAGLPTDFFGSQNFQTFSTRQTPHLGD